MKQMDSRINVPNSSVRHKNNTCGLVDRMSALPDSILGVILSFLPTKDAVATTILSKRWKLVWMIVDNLDFQHTDCWGKKDEGKDMKFIQFVNGVLHLHDAGFLNKFSLVWHPCCISSHAISWISTAITRKVHELYLHLNDLVGHFDMPISVFCCDSLRSLQLDGAISVSASIAVCLPKLESLVLLSVYFESEEAFERLISTCPMLNYLYIHDHDEEDAFTYMISSASLRRIDVHLMNDHSLILEASSLEYLKLGLYEISVLKNLSSLVEAEFYIGLFGDELSQPDFCNSIVGVVHEFDYAKALNLSADVMGALSCGTINLSNEFKRLVKLETEAYCCACSSIQDFIQCSDNLEVLTIHKDSVYPGDRDFHDHSKWTTPVEVPRCLSNSLKKVVINGYEGLEDEREMIRYMLEHGSVLEVMHISCDKAIDGEKSELIQEIREFPRKSAACKVKTLSTLHAR